MQAEIARKVTILAQAQCVADGRTALHQCGPELGRLFADARCELSLHFPRSFVHEGLSFRLGLQGTLFIYARDDERGPALTPLLPSGIGCTAGHPPLRAAG